MGKLVFGGLRLGVVGLGLVALTGCALLAPFPEPTTVEQRLATFPTRNLRVEKPVEIRWNENQVPYVIAQTDGDAAYAMGLVQAHLRLSQLAMGRRIAQGRMSQMFGPTFRGLDKTLRAIGMERSAKESLEMMPPESREWLQRFVDGLNDYQAKLEEAPFEFWLMNIKREKWTPADILAMGRLGSIDFNWAHYATLLSKRHRKDWPEIWARALQDGIENPVSFHSSTASRHAELPREAQQFIALLTGVKRSGSNSYVVSGERTKSGAAMIASDPHLGFYLPNLWMIAGLKTPTQHVVGFMPPGVPVFAMGRNWQVAWGGTNLYAASSDLVDVSDLPEDAFTTERHDIDVRFWFDSESENRVTEYGPVITDVDFVRDSFGLTNGEEFALSWVGRLPSDEITSFLSVHRSSDFEEFRASFDNFLLPGQNMMYADVEGNIGHLIATQVPRRSEGLPDDLVITPAEYEQTWTDLVRSPELPYAYNPESGFLASANNKPYEGGVPVGYFFALPDRILRLNELLSGDGNITMDDLKKIQLDVYSDRAHDIKERLVARLERGGTVAFKGEAAGGAWKAMKDWDGNYRPGSRGALAVEVFFNAIAPGLAETTGREDQLEDLVEAGAMRRLVDEAMTEVNDATLLTLAQTAMDETVEVLRTHRTWGEIHRLRLNHPMAYAPLFGERFRFADLPGPGSSETLLKTAHIPTTHVHEAEYGSLARHISDMSDPDANYFVLAGGQDGWINSSTYLDQVKLWKNDKFIQMPLTAEKIKRQFPYVTRLMPNH